MAYMSEDCSSGLHTYCNHKCECSCHELTYLNLDELRILFHLLSHQYIPYSNEDAMRVVRKIVRIVEEHELGPTSSRPT